MRIEYAFRLDDVPVPRFSIEAVEGIGKLFTLATLVMNVMSTKSRVEIVFHGLNPDDPGRKIDAFRDIFQTSDGAAGVQFKPGHGGKIPGSSSYFQWLLVEKA
jgi:hypothetical protein